MPRAKPEALPGQNKSTQVSYIPLARDTTNLYYTMLCAVVNTDSTRRAVLVDEV